MTLVLLLHYLYRIMFTHHISYSPANTSVTVESHTEGSGEQGTSLQELEATAASVKQPCSGCRTGMRSLSSCPSSSAPVHVGVPPKPSRLLMLLQPQALMLPSTLGRAPGGQCLRDPTLTWKDSSYTEEDMSQYTYQHALKYIDHCIYKNACASELYFAFC